MIKFEHTKVFNFEGALRGMRNPLNSWNKSDSRYGCSYYSDCEDCDQAIVCDSSNAMYLIGENDMVLAQNLVKAGTDHRKFLRQIFVSVDIVAPSFWWPEFDTYKVATVRNSCSKMHTIHIKEFEEDDFTHEGIDSCGRKTRKVFLEVLEELERLRQLFNEKKDKRYWRAIIELLPHGYNMRSTVTLNYEVLRNIYNSRENHKLDEWSVDFMQWIDTLPYAEELIKY